MNPIRLQRFLARCGLGSRRSCEELIRNGRVSVNDRTINELGARVEENDVVKVDGKVVKPGDLRYFILNKPKGTISVNKDHKDRTYVVDLIPGGREMGLFPVGRLDLDTTGLLIITNDGDLANRIAHPRYGIRKQYTALIKGTWTKGALEEATGNGVRLDDGHLVKDIEILRTSLRESRTRVTIGIKEGRKHVVKRIFLALGSRVYELHRDAIGDLGIGGLEVGGCKEVDRKLIMEKVGITIRDNSGNVQQY